MISGQPYPLASGMVNHGSRYHSVFFCLADADLIAAPENADIAPKNGECLVATAQRSQSSPSSIIEDSGTESGEDLRLLNPELLAEVRGALSKLESALPTLDTARRASIIPLVTKLQSCLQVSQTPHSATGSQSLLPCKRYASAKQQLRKNRHTIGVSKEELADARKWLAENFLDDSEPQPAPKQPATNCIPMKYESKQYKPVKFTPIPPRERQPEVCEYPLTTGRVEAPVVYRAEEQNLGMQPQFACRAYTEPDLTAPHLLYRKHYTEEPQMYKENFSSDEGDVSSTEEEASKAEPNPLNGGIKVQYSPCYEAPKKVPIRFHQKNNKKMRMKRANTIDIPKLLTCENVTSSGDESICRSADEMNRRNATIAAQVPKVSVAPPLEIRTEKDKKFANFLRQTMQDEQQAKTVAYNPCAAGGAQWSNRFSNIKTAFESVNHQKSSSSPEDMSSKKFKPIRKVAPTLAKEKACIVPHAQFTHAPQSPFKPVPKVSAFYDCTKPRSRDSGYDSHTNSVYQPDHNSLPKHFFNSLDRKTAHSVNTPKTYYTPMHSHAAQPHPKRPTHAIGYSTNGYKTDSHLSPYYGNAPGYYESYQNNMRVKPYATKQNYHYPAPKPEYFLNEPSAYLHIPEYAATSNSISSQPVSPTIPTTCSSSPTYPEVYEPYVSLPTSPLHNQFSKQVPTTHWKPAEYYEEQPAIAKIMGKPQQAVVVNSKTNYRNETAPVINTASNSGARTDKSSTQSTYQKLAQNSPLLQNFAQHVPRTVSKESKPVAPASKPVGKVGSPVAPRKQVKIIAAGLNDDEENLPEQFFVQNQRSKFESLSAGSTAPQPLPPQMNEKAFFKPVSAPAAPPSAVKKRRQSPPVIVQQCRSPPHSPVMMPSVLQKSESWHQMIMERMKQAKPPSPIKPKIPRAKSTHNLACAPKQYEAALTPEAIEQKKHTVEQFLGKSQQQNQLRQTEKIPVTHSRTTKHVQKQENSTKSVTVTKLNEDFKHVDEAFELLFSEASAKKS